MRWQHQQNTYTLNVDILFQLNIDDYIEIIYIDIYQRNKMLYIM